MMKVMVIDGEIHQLREIADEIGIHYVLLNCSRGAKALELFRIFEPDAAILDPATPGLDAMEIIHEAQSRPGKTHVPILLMSRFTTLRHIERGFDWGADYVFSKPCSVDRISRKLAECLEKARRYHQTQLIEL